MIDIRFIVFHSNFTIKINTLLHAFKPIFPDGGNYETCVLKVSDALSVVKNCCTRSLCLMCRNSKIPIVCKIRSVRRISHQFDVFAFRKFIRLNQCVRARIVIMKLLFFCFFPFLRRVLANKWKCTIQNRLSSVTLTPLLPCDR